MAMKVARTRIPIRIFLSQNLDVVIWRNISVVGFHSTTSIPGSGVWLNPAPGGRGRVGGKLTQFGI